MKCIDRDAIVRGRVIKVAHLDSDDRAPANALIAHSVRACAERKLRCFAYQKSSYEIKDDDSLTHFKSINGFERIDVPRYHIPLTSLGKLALRTGLHHKLVDQLSKPVSAKLRDLRSSWYNRKIHSQVGAS